MTNRYNALVVVLRKGMRDDDLKPLINAIRQLRDVADVRPGAPEGYEHHVARMQIQTEMREKFWKVLTED